MYHNTVVSPAGHRVRPVAAALVASLFLTCCGAGDTIAPASGTGGPPLLAMTAPTDTRFCRPLQIGDGSYRIRNGAFGAEVVVWLNGVETVVSGGLDIVRAATVGEVDEGDYRLVLAGCLGSTPRVTVLEDADSDGRVDEVAGFSNLPVGAVPDDIAVDLKESVFFLRCVSGAQLLRAVDSNDDQVPDGVWQEFTPSGFAIDTTHTHVVINSPSSVVVRVAPPFSADDEVTVLRDLDDDGVADSAVVEGAFDSAPMYPRLRWQPRVQDTSLTVRGSPLTSVSIYEVDSAGATLGSALGSATLDALGLGVISIGSALPEGTYLRLKDVTNELWAEVWDEVVANYPLLSSASPLEFEEGVGGTLTITGSGFNAAASFRADLVELGGDGVVADLAVAVNSDTSMTVQIPSTVAVPAGESFSAWQVVVASSTTGHSALRVDISVQAAP